MKSNARNILATVACLAIGTVAWAQQPETPGAQPSPAESQVTSASPSPGYVWMSGHWNSEGGQWKWVAAHWELPPSRSAVWIEGHWMASGSTWVWSNGAWNVGAPTQTSANPPQLPTQSTEAAAAAEQGVPMPYTPPPNVNGQFTQGSQVPVIDQPPVVTDYGPDYSTAYYPGYYWTGNTWLWGGYPGYYGFGLGLGPVIFGFGHGWGFHGGGFAGHGGGHFR
jgi:WXXGXW repeat (2 copies)